MRESTAFEDVACTQAEHGAALHESTVMNVLVKQKHYETSDICSFELVDPDGGPLPAFTAGSHIDIHMPGGLVRQYSLCNNPSETHRYVISVLLDPASRGGSRYMHQVAEGSTLSIGKPRNLFPMDQMAHKSLLLAGGIGITPLLSMAEHLADFGAVFEMHYCTRSPERTAFRDRIRNSRLHRAAHFHHDDGPTEQRFDLEAVLQTPRPEDEIHLYVCGPKGFMEAVLKRARANGWLEHQLHYEFFSAERTHFGAGEAFDIELAKSRKVIHVRTNQTVVGALRDGGVEIPTSCEQGVCGTCLTRVVDGIPDHRDMYLTPEERARNDQFLPCCSRAKSSRLILDL